MVNGFIRLYTNGRDENVGFKLNASIVTNFGFNKGIQTTDLATPGQTTRVLFPTTGLIEDFNISIQLIDDGENKGFQITSNGTEIPMNIVTIDQQVNFLLDNLFSTNVSTEHGVRVDYLNREVIGNIQLRGNITENEYFSLANVEATVQVGRNIFGLG